jgi:hypothetical protein
MKSCLILINGHPGVGKHTIAKLVHQGIGAKSLFIHNHLLIDPVEAIHPGRTVAHYALRKKFRDVAFDALIADQNPERIIILTVCLGQNEVDAAVMREHLRIAQERRTPVCWVNLTCDSVVEHHDRIAEDERKSGRSTKFTDTELLDALKSETALLTAADITEEVKDVGVSFCVQDTSDKSPEESSRATLFWLESCCAEAGQIRRQYA